MFDIRGYLETSIFEITRVHCLFILYESSFFSLISYHNIQYNAHLDRWLVHFLSLLPSLSQTSDLMKAPTRGLNLNLVWTWFPVFGQAHQGADGWFLLLQSFTVCVSAEPSPLFHFMESTYLYFYHMSLLRYYPDRFLTMGLETRLN